MPTISEPRFFLWTTETDALNDQSAVNADLGYTPETGINYFAIVPSGSVYISYINTEFPTDILPDKPRLTKAEANALGADIF